MCHEVAPLFLDHCLDRLGAERADQLGLEIGFAGEEAQLFEARTVRDCAVATSFEAAAEVTLLWCVVQPCESWLLPLGGQVLEEASDVGGAAKVHDLDLLVVEVPALARGQCEQGGRSLAPSTRTRARLPVHATTVTWSVGCVIPLRPGALLASATCAAPRTSSPRSRSVPPPRSVRSPPVLAGPSTSSTRATPRWPRVPDMVGKVDVLLGNLEDAIKADNKPPLARFW